MHRFSRACLIGLCVGSMLTAPVAAQTRSAGLADVVINMRDIELSAVAEQISRITGRTLILDPNVKGTVNVVSAEPLTPDGVWDLFLSVLRVHGYGAVRSGAAWRIVPLAAAVQGAGPVGVRAARPQELVTTLIPLRNLPVGGGGAGVPAADTAICVHGGAGPAKRHRHHRLRRERPAH